MSRGVYDEWIARPFRVQLEDDDGGRFWVKIPAAIGRHDATHKAEYGYPDYHVIQVQPFVCDNCPHPIGDHNPLNGKCRGGASSAEQFFPCHCVNREALLYPGQVPA